MIAPFHLSCSPALRSVVVRAAPIGAVRTRLLPGEILVPDDPAAAGIHSRLVTALVAFMFQWLSAFVDWTPSLSIGRIPADLAGNDRIQGTVEFADVARVS